MKRLIEKYTPPTAAKIIALKNKLQYSGADMSALAGVSSDAQFRKYTTSETPRPVSMHILFYMAAQLALEKHELERVLDKMAEIGADVD